MADDRDQTSRQAQADDLPGKLVAALDRLARAQRQHRQSAASRLGVTPLQGELLRTLADGPPPTAVVGLLARELGVSQPTVTESVTALERKGLVVRSKARHDRRRTQLVLTAAGHELVAALAAAEAEVIDAVATLAHDQMETTYVALLGMIQLFVERGLLEVARTCLTCRYLHDSRDTGRHCLLLDMALPDAALRVNCPEHEPAASAHAEHGPVGARP